MSLDPVEIALSQIKRREDRIAYLENMMTTRAARLNDLMRPGAYIVPSIEDTRLLIDEVQRLHRVITYEVKQVNPSTPSPRPKKAEMARAISRLEDRVSALEAFYRYSNPQAHSQD